jgi:hypothetical protein
MSQYVCISTPARTGPQRRNALYGNMIHASCCSVLPVAATAHGCQAATSAALGVTRWGGAVPYTVMPDR